MISDVAQIRASIEQEVRSLAMLSQFTKRASHEIINGHYLNLDVLSEQHRALVSEEEHNKILYEIYDHYVF